MLAVATTTSTKLARLQDLARTINEMFDQPDEIVDALMMFDHAVPNLRRIRNPLTHLSDDNRLDGVAWFDSVVKLLPNGAVDYLVDPRYEHHDLGVVAQLSLDTLTPKAALRALHNARYRALMEAPARR